MFFVCVNAKLCVKCMIGNIATMFWLHHVTSCPVIDLFSYFWGCIIRVNSLKNKKKSEIQELSYPLSMATDARLFKSRKGNKNIVNLFFSTMYCRKSQQTKTTMYCCKSQQTIH